MELSDSIKSAWDAVEDSGVPEHMQEVAFREALRHRLGAAPQNPSGSSGVRPSTSQAERHQANYSNESEQRAEVAEDEVFQRVSTDSGVPVDKLEQVFHIDGGVVKLIGRHTKYGARTTDQARAVAHIVAVVRKLGMGYAGTSFDIIKEACESKHCYDSTNFASKHMPPAGFVIKGEKRSRRLEAKSGGISAFPDLIDKVLGIS